MFKKKVTFAIEGKAVSIHYIVAWKYAYHQARKGGLDSVVPDRHRFQRRIHDNESTIGKK